MGTEIIPAKFSATLLDTELENARATLRGVEDSIKRVFGKDASELNTFQQRPRRSFHPEGRTVQEVPVGISDQLRGPRHVRERENDSYDSPNDKRRRFDGGGGDSIIRKRSAPIVLTSNLIRPRDTSADPEYGNGVQFDNGDGHGDGSRNQRLQSRIVSSAKEKSREEVLAEQRQDRGRDRNRRMFSALLGTLHQFKQDETKLKEKEDRRAQIEAKLEEQAMQEKEEVKREKQKLMRDHKTKVTEIKRLEYKKHRLEELEDWEAKTKFLKNFIRTESKPNIFYLPKRMNPIAECRLDESRQIVEEMIANKRKSVMAGLEAYEEHHRRYFERKQSDDAAPAGGNAVTADPLDVNLEDELKALMKDVEAPSDELVKRHVAGKSATTEQDAVETAEDTLTVETSKDAPEEQ